MHARFAPKDPCFVRLEMVLTRCPHGAYVARWESVSCGSQGFDASGTYSFVWFSIRESRASPGHLRSQSIPPELYSEPHHDTLYCFGPVEKITS